MKPCVVSVSKYLGFDSFIPVHSVSVPVGLTIVTNRQRNIFAGTSVHLAKVASFCLLVGMRPAGYHMLAEQFVAAFSAMAVSLMAGNATNPIVFKQRSPCCIMSDHEVPAATVGFQQFRASHVPDEGPACSQASLFGDNLPPPSVVCPVVLDASFCPVVITEGREGEVQHSSDCSWVVQSLASDLRFTCAGVQPIDLNDLLEQHWSQVLFV